MSELGTIGFGLVVLLAAVGGAAFLTWFERRLLGVWQDRYGPNRLGPMGVFQVLADMIKLLTKHDWVPPFADRLVFIFAPTAIVVAMLLGFAVVPFGPDLYIIDINIGLLFFLGMTSLAVYSVLLGGLASRPDGQLRSLYGTVADGCGHAHWQLQYARNCGSSA
jgi:NADH-quinone oxidoreductase subunit H